MTSVRHFVDNASCAAQVFARRQTPESLFLTPHSGARPRPVAARLSPRQEDKQDSCKLLRVSHKNIKAFFFLLYNTDVSARAWTLKTYEGASCEMVDASFCHEEAGSSLADRLLEKFAPGSLIKSRKLEF